MSGLKAEIISHFLVEEILPRLGSLLQIVSDNGLRNINKSMIKTLGELNLYFIISSK